MMTSCLCDPTTYDSQADVNLLAQTYNDTAEKLLDVHAPWSKVRCRVRRKTDPWYDSDCRAAKRRTRKLEWRYKRRKSVHSRSVWLQSLRSMHKLVDQKRSDYWHAKTESQVSARDLWRAVDAILCRDNPSAANHAHGERLCRHVCISSLNRKWRRYVQLLTAHRHRRSRIHSRS